MTNDEFAIVIQAAMLDAQRASATDPAGGGYAFELGFLKARLETICEELQAAKP